jgi:hypothetical protein
MAFSQVLVFPYDTSTVNVDGVISPAEWQYAAMARIPANGTDTVTVFFKHDTNGMFFAFIGKLESANALFPEVLVDPQHLRTNTWVPGQWWFHVSATDCENDGAYGVYTNCLLTQPGWTGAPNMATGMPYTDTIEISIPFNKVGYNILTADTVGIAMMVTNTATIYKMYPGTADRNVPATWAQAVFSSVQASVKDGLASRVNVHIAPNPATDRLAVTCEKGFTYEIYELAGKLVRKGLGNAGKTTVNVSDLAPSVYMLRLRFGDGTTKAIKFTKE